MHTIRLFHPSKRASIIMTDDDEVTPPPPDRIVPTRKDEPQQSMMGDLFSLVDEGKKLLGEIVKKPTRPAQRKLEEEPFDPAIQFALRALVIDCVHQGGVRLTIHENQFQVIIGDGINMRISEGSTQSEAILRACEKEGTRIDDAGLPRR